MNKRDYPIECGAVSMLALQASPTRQSFGYKEHTSC